MLGDVSGSGNRDNQVAGYPKFQLHQVADESTNFTQKKTASKLDVLCFGATLSFQDRTKRGVLLVVMAVISASNFNYIFESIHEEQGESMI